MLEILVDLHQCDFNRLVRGVPIEFDKGLFLHLPAGLQIFLVERQDLGVT